MPARILIIEDNHLSLDLMNYLLSAFGYTTLTAVDGLEGYDAVRRERPDLILCDVQLPGIDGYEIARRLKLDSNLRAIPLIAITALAMVGDREKVLAAGFDGYISKPITPETFVAEVENYIRPDLQSDYVHKASATEQQGAVSIGSRGKILVVDDSSINLDLARSTLEPFGFTVIAAKRMNDALDLARKENPDVIISDVHMAHGTGFDFIALLKSDPALSHIPLIFITSTYTEPDYGERALKLGAAGYLIRPIEPHVLVAEVEGCLKEQEDSHG